MTALPHDVLVCVFLHFASTPLTLLSAALVSKKWNRAALSDDVWLAVSKIHFPIATVSLTAGGSAIPAEWRRVVEGFFNTAQGWGNEHVVLSRPENAPILDNLPQLSRPALPSPRPVPDVLEPALPAPSAGACTALDALGSMIVAGHSDGGTSVWMNVNATHSGQTKCCDFVLGGHRAAVTSVAIHPDSLNGDRMVVCTSSIDTSIILWSCKYDERNSDENASTQAQHTPVNLPPSNENSKILNFAHAAAVNQVAFSSAGTVWSNNLLSCSDDGFIRLRDLESLLPILTITEHSAPVYCCVFGDSVHPYLAISGSFDNSSRLFDLRNGSQVLKLTKNSFRVYGIAQHHHSIVTGSGDGFVREYDLRMIHERGIQLFGPTRPLIGRPGGNWVESVILDRTQILAGGGDGVVDVWDRQGNYHGFLEMPPNRLIWKMKLLDPSFVVNANHRFVGGPWSGALAIALSDGNVRMALCDLIPRPDNEMRGAPFGESNRWIRKNWQQGANGASHKREADGTILQNQQRTK